MGPSPPQIVCISCTYYKGYITNGKPAKDSMGAGVFMDGFAGAGLHNGMAISTVIPTMVVRGFVMISWLKARLATFTLPKISLKEYSFPS